MSTTAKRATMEAIYKGLTSIGVEVGGVPKDGEKPRGYIAEVVSTPVYTVKYSEDYEISAILQLVHRGDNTFGALYDLIDKIKSELVLDIQGFELNNPDTIWGASTSSQDQDEDGLYQIEATVINLSITKI